MNPGKTEAWKPTFCPRCRFPNAVGATICLSCKGSLTGNVAWQDAVALPRSGAPPTRRVPREEMPERPPTPIQKPQGETLEPSSVLVWLVCDPLPPLPVKLDGVVTIGRGDDCQLVLPHASVSREHAVLRVIGKEIVFEDRSTFGSYVNGERLLSATVKPGDTLTIGPYEIKVAACDSVHGGVAQKGDTRPLGQVRTLASPDAMTGRLEKQPLTEVLQALEFNKKTGTLDLVCDDHSGLLVLYAGAPIHATFGELSGEDAVMDMVARREGYYAFRTKIEAGEQTISRSMTALLLEANRRIDEGTTPS